MFIVTGKSIETSFYLGCFRGAVGARKERRSPASCVKELQGECWHDHSCPRHKTRPQQAEMLFGHPHMHGEGTFLTVTVANCTICPRMRLKLNSKLMKVPLGIIWVNQPADVALL